MLFNGDKVYMLPSVTPLQCMGFVVAGHGDVIAIDSGTAAETETICRETLEIMMRVRGYHFAPTHAIQDNTPVENVIAMYNAAHRYGRYE